MRFTETEKHQMIKQLMQKYSLLDYSYADFAIEFVSEVLELEIEYTKQNEPYATNSIREMQFANTHVRGLLDVIEEMRKKQ